MNNNSIKENKKKCDNKSKVSIDAITVIEQSGSELIIPQSSRSSSLDSLQIVVPQSEQRTKNILKTETNIPSMKQICVSNFLYYSNFSFEEKDFVLSQNNLTKLLKEMKIISNNGLKSYEVDLLFTKMKNKCKKMISKDFLNLLVQISEKIFHQDFVKSPQIALQKLNDKYTQPYYEYLTNPKSIINPNSIFSFHQNIEKKIKILSFDPNILFIFNDIYPSLKTIYCLYFLTETNGQGNLDIIIKDSLEHLISFSKEFEITPYFVEINKIVIIYHIVLELTPYEITKYIKNGLEIKFVKDIGSYTKAIYAFKEYPESIIVTADDDIYYPKKWLEKLYHSYIAHPKDIQVHRAHRVKLKDNKILPYEKWEKHVQEESARFDNFLTGVGGVLYPPNCFLSEVFRDDIFLNYAPTADDIWFWFMALISNRKIRVVQNHIKTLRCTNLLRQILPNRKTLYSINSTGRNDEQIKNLMKFYQNNILHKII